MRTLVVGPHPDDELLGCGGLLLRRLAEGHEVAWILVTSMIDASANRIEARDLEIEAVRDGLGIRPESLIRCGFPTTRLDAIPMAELVNALSQAIVRLEPTEVLVPHSRDAHSDHRVTFDATMAATKWFRQPNIRRILAYETLSETEFGSGPAFRPRYFADISPWLDKKIELLKIYASELGEFPFPRSEETVRSLAAVRGSAAGFNAAEAFDIIRWNEALETES